MNGYSRVIGWKLDRAERGELLKRFPPRYRDTIADHVTLKAGTNAHHVAEACFKALARSLRMAVETDPRSPDSVPSTKGMLEG